MINTLLAKVIGTQNERELKRLYALVGKIGALEPSIKDLSDAMLRARTAELKQRVARLIKANGWPMVMNVVIHRLNIDHIDRIIEMAHGLGAEYVELANTQYYSWAFLNRAQLLPTREQLLRAEQETDRWREKLGDRMRIFFVSPDYHEARPKKCVNGWGNIFLTIAPDGTALPCHTARMLPGLTFPNVRDMALKEIWFDSEGFNHYRGTGWMKEPCASFLLDLRCRVWLRLPKTVRLDDSLRRDERLRLPQAVQRLADREKCQQARAVAYTPFTAQARVDAARFRAQRGELSVSSVFLGHNRYPNFSNESVPP